MGPKTKELIDCLEKICPVLRQSGDTMWADWMERASGLLKNGDFTGILQVLGAYGGMGSFNDVVVSGKAEALRSRIYELASSIKREVESK